MKEPDGKNRAAASIYRSQFIAPRTLFLASHPFLAWLQREFAKMKHWIGLLLGRVPQLLVLEAQVTSYSVCTGSLGVAVVQMSAFRFVLCSFLDGTFPPLVSRVNAGLGVVRSSPSFTQHCARVGRRLINYISYTADCRLDKTITYLYDSCTSEICNHI